MNDREKFAAKDEGYLDSLLKSMEGTKPDYREDLPKKKSSSEGYAAQGSRISHGEAAKKASALSASDNWDEEDDLDREIRQKLGRKKSRSEKSQRRRNRRDKQDSLSASLSGESADTDDIKMVDGIGGTGLDAGNIISSSADNAPDRGDIILDSEAGAPDIGDIAIDSEAGAPDIGDIAIDSEASAPDFGDIALESEASAPGSEDVTFDGGGIEADNGNDDDLMALLSDGGSGDIGLDDNAAALDDAGSDDDLMALLSDDAEDTAPKDGEDDLMALLSENDEEVNLVSDDDLLALMDEDSGLSSSDAGSDDLDSLMGMIGTDGGLELDGDDQDIFSLDDLMGEESEPKKSEAGKSSDVGDIIADSLSAVSSGENEESLEAQVLGSVSENKEKKKKKKKFGAFFAKIFGNIVDDKSKKQFEAEKEEEAKAEFKRSEKARIKAGNLTEEEQKQKEAKEAAAAQAKEEKAQAKENKKAQAEAKKAEKLEKKKKKAEERAAEEALSVDEGRINRAGASVVFLFFAGIAAFILLGSNQFTYATSIKNAGNYFNMQKYNKAYNEVSGLKIKQKDEEIYSKIMTVMYVNKELNSYNNYYDIQHYGEALDSLLKGLKRYDKYIADARELGIESDLNYVRRQILAELKRTFGISEAEAVSLNEIEDQAEYSSRVINLAEKVTNQ